ncbi:hypothetical protein GJ629_04165 [Halapricum sp. CBA1109]|uniref:hypothetical protein n=1 Tax=Halapricum sp. CBA1109 TaxID=2668068 RepID=UPI0012FA6582|nr:hypothetical protein [Halapricum sp. CBA1109]MUV89190.1 hypothetical protein [Halapricum sp. CBA1109]
MAESEPADADEPLNPESILVAVDALQPADDGDLSLTDSFRSAWDEEIADVKATADREDEIRAVIGIEDSDVSFESHNEAYKILVDGNLVGLLESEAALYADLAAARLLMDRYEAWDDLSIADRSRLLKGLRLFLETCPDCGNDVTFDTEEVESCCGSYPVAAVDCGECGSRLFESAPLEQ